MKAHSITKARILCTTVVLLTLLIGVRAQWRTDMDKTLRIAELNCENLFDTVHTEGFNDLEFTPNGARHWTTQRYRSKLSKIARELVSLHQSRPIDIIALVEVENDTVLRDLTERTHLNALGYKYIVTHGRDPRGINVALLYLEGSMRVLNTHAIDWRQRGVTTVGTRDMLHVEGLTRSGDTLHILVCHMPSRLGGRPAQNRREAIAHELRRYADSTLSVNPQRNLLIIGDFNDSPTNKKLQQSLGAIDLAAEHDNPSFAPSPTALYNISSSPRTLNDSKGTYCYQGHWESIDQCFVSGQLLSPNNHLHLSNPNVLIADHLFLLEDDKKYGGRKPWRTYQGPMYHGGFSDHLPIVVELVY